MLLDAATNKKCEINYDGTTVWVNGENGDCLARFGRLGIDIHHSARDQIAGQPQCLSCTHTKPDGKDWENFKLDMAALYHVEIPEEARPNWLTI